jgi:hypothetical protein
MYRAFMILKFVKCVAVAVAVAVVLRVIILESISNTVQSF